MKTTDLIANKRENLGKRGTRNLRQEGKIPAVVYDNGQATHITLEYKSSKHVVFTPDTYIIKLDIEGDKIDTLIHDVQYHPTKDTIEHLELLRISPDKEVELNLPVKLVGTPAGVIQGGKMMTNLRKIKVRGIPEKLPDYVEIDVTSLELGTTIKVRDANIEGLEILTSPTAAVASVEIPRSLRSAQAGQEGGDTGAGEVQEVAE